MALIPGKRRPGWFTTFHSVWATAPAHHPYLARKSIGSLISDGCWKGTTTPPSTTTIRCCWRHCKDPPPNGYLNHPVPTRAARFLRPWASARRFMTILHQHRQPVGGITIRIFQKDLEERHQQAFDPWAWTSTWTCPVWVPQVPQAALRQSSTCKIPNIHLLQQAVWTADYAVQAVHRRRGQRSRGRHAPEKSAGIQLP